MKYILAILAIFAVLGCSNPISNNDDNISKTVNVKVMFNNSSAKSFCHIYSNGIFIDSIQKLTTKNIIVLDSSILIASFLNRDSAFSPCTTIAFNNLNWIIN